MSKQNKKKQELPEFRLDRNYCYYLCPEKYFKVLKIRTSDMMIAKKIFVKSESKPKKGV